MSARPLPQEGGILPPSWRYGESATRLLDLGYSPLPIKPGTKSALVKGWNEFGARRPSLRTVEGWSRRFGDWGIGAATGDLVGIDIDILDPAEAERMHRSAVEAFGDTPLVRIGQSPKVMLFYRAAAPFPSFDVGKVQIMALGRQAVLFAVHPDTGRPYSWIDETPLDVPVSALPEIGEAYIRQWLNPTPQRGEMLPPSEGGDAAPLLPMGRVAFDGERGVALFSVAIAAARTAPDYEFVLAAVREFNAVKCFPSAEDFRAVSAARSAWHYRVTGRLYPASGQQWGAVSAIELLDLVGNPAALCLLILLRQAHGLNARSGVVVSPGAIEKSALLGKWDKKRIRAARDYLVMKGYLLLEKQGTGECHPNEYRLTGPKLGRPQEGGETPLYVIEHPSSVSLPLDGPESEGLNTTPATDNSAGPPVETAADQLKSDQKESNRISFQKSDADRVEIDGVVYLPRPRNQKTRSQRDPNQHDIEDHLAASVTIAGRGASGRR